MCNIVRHSELHDYEICVVDNRLFIIVSLVFKILSSHENESV